MFTPVPVYQAQEQEDRDGKKQLTSTGCVQVSHLINRDSNLHQVNDTWT